LINPKVYIQELIDSGLTKEEAYSELKKEIQKRKMIKKKQIKFQNDFSNSFRTNCQRYRR